MTQEWRCKMERRVFDLEHALELARIRGATKVDIWNSEIRTIKWVGCMLAILVFGFMFGLVVARL